MTEQTIEALGHTLKIVSKENTRDDIELVDLVFDGKELPHEVPFLDGKASLERPKVGETMNWMRFYVASDEKRFPGLAEVMDATVFQGVKPDIKSEQEGESMPMRTEDEVRNEAYPPLYAVTYGRACRLGSSLPYITARAGLRGRADGAG